MAVDLNVQVFVVYGGDIILLAGNQGDPCDQQKQQPSFKCCFHHL
jgi:hypothetical protein